MGSWGKYWGRGKWFGWFVVQGWGFCAPIYRAKKKQEIEKGG